MYYLDLLGTFAFAAGGAYKARSRRLNVFGAIFLGTITAIGGGTMRDLILGRTPLFYLLDSNYLLVCLCAGFMAHLVPNLLNKTYSIFRFMDSIGLAAFVIIGVSICHNHLFSSNSLPTLLSSLSCVITGVLTGCGGGIFRDAIMGDVPFYLKSGSHYITSAFIGSILYFFLMFSNNSLAVAVSMTVTLILRELISPYGMYRKLRKKTRTGRLSIKNKSNKL